MINEIDKVTFMHFRIPVSLYERKDGKPDLFYRYYRRRSPWQPNPRGGKTVCVIRTKDCREFIGEALCSMADNFCYKTGSRIAFERAAEHLSLVMTWSLPDKDIEVHTSIIPLGNNKLDKDNASSGNSLRRLGSTFEVEMVFEFEQDLSPEDRRMVIESAVEKMLFLDPWLGLVNPLLALRVFTDGQEVYKKTIQDAQSWVKGDE